MDHVVIPLGRDHLAALATLAEGAARAAGLPGSVIRARPHVTIVAFTGVTRPAALVAVEEALVDTAPFALHAHGFGFFTGDQPEEISLHVPIVRSGPLDSLHRGVCDALHRAGALVAGWTEPGIWSPHVTLLDRGLDPRGLGAAAEWLAGHRHPSWHIAVDRLVVTGGWGSRDEQGDLVRLVAR